MNEKETSMNGLAEIALDYFLTIVFADGEVIDNDYQCRLQESFSEMILPLTEAERVALSDAAQRALEEINKGPDEHGYDPGLQVPDDQREFLNALASGELYNGLVP